MKTFYFNPNNFGNTYVVMAKTYEEAVEYITKYCIENDELDLFQEDRQKGYIELKEGEVFQGCTC